MNAARPKPNLRAVQKAQTRAAIMDSALRLFNEVGVYGTTIDQIVSDVGASRATFYLHFPDKEAVLIALIDDYLGRAVEELGKLPGPYPDRDQIDAWLKDLADFFRRESASVTIITEIGAMQPSLPDFIKRSLAALTEALGRNIPAFRPGAFGPDKETERQVAADLQIAQLSWAARSAAHREDAKYGEVALKLVGYGLHEFVHHARRMDEETKSEG